MGRHSHFILLGHILMLRLIISTAGDSVKKPTTTFSYFHRDNPNVPLTLEQVQEMKDKPQNVLLYSHGFNSESLEDAGSTKIKDDVLQNRKDVDIVILADWCEASDKPLWKYPSVAEKTVPLVAHDIATELEKLSKTVGISPKNMEMVGHSLGAHVVGQAGRQMIADGVGSVKKITGLDPAGPSYRGSPYNGLTKGDADWVSVIHTDDLLGIFRDIGDEDIYPYTQEEFRNCEKAALVSRCLHDLAKGLYSKQQQGQQLVDKNDPKRGKERIKIPKMRYSTQVTVLVLDVSPSMQAHGRMESMISASKQLITQLPINSTVAIVIFGGSAQISQSPVRIKDESVRASVLSKLPTPSTQIGWTSIGAGLKAAVNLTPFMAESCPDIHLITDGEENKAPWRKDVKIPPCTRVNPIALGDKADPGLEQLSRDTNGRMASVSDVNSLTKLGEALSDATYADMDPSVRPLRVYGGDIVLSEQEKIDFKIDRDIGKKLKVVMYSPINNKLLTPTLTSPDGTLYTDFQKDGSALVFQQEVAQSGDWKFRFSSTLASGKTRVTRNADIVKGTLTITSLQRDDHTAIVLDGFISSSLINYNDNSTPIAIYGRIQKGLDFVLGAKVEAIVTDPDGKVLHTLDLNDNGVGADEDGNDGVYSRYLVTSLKPLIRYEISIIASCNPSCRLRAKTSYSFVPITNEEMEQLPTLYSFRRQVNAGSIKAEGTYHAPLPSRIQNLEVISINKGAKSVHLKWNAGGGVADSGNASRLELTATWNYSKLVMLKRNEADGDDNNELFMFGDNISAILNGGLIPLEAGENQNVTIEIPEVLWTKSGNGEDIYFVMRAENMDRECGEYSNIASIPDDDATDSDTVVWPYIGAALIMSVASLGGCYWKFVKP